MTATPSPIDSPRLAALAGVCALLFAVAAPWSIAAAQTSVIAGALVLVSGAATRRTAPLRLTPTVICVLGFLATQVLSIPFSVHPGRSLLLLKDSWLLLFPFVFLGLLRQDRARHRALVIFALSGGLAGLYGIVQHFAGVDWLRGRPLENYGGGGYVAVGTFGHLTYAGVLLPVFFVAAGLFLEERRRLLALATVACSLGLLFAFARTAWIGLAVGLLVLGGLTRGRKAVVGVTLALLGVVALAAVSEPALRHRILSIFAIGDDPRTRLWRTALRIFVDHPILGAGLGSFKTLFPRYHVPGTYMSTIHPHSDLLNHLVESGLIGAAAWIAIWVAFFVETRGHRSPLLHAMRAGVAALLAAGLGQCYSTDEEPAQAWWFLVAAALWTAHSLKVSSAAPEVSPVGRRRRSLWRGVNRRFKKTTLPIAARLLAPRRRAVTSATGKRQILLVRQDNRLGNLLLMTPFLRRLREGMPEANLVFLCGEAYAPVVRGWPWVDEWIVQPKRRHAAFPPLFLPWIRSVRARHWDVAFELSNHNTHSFYNCLLALAAGAEERIGFDHPRSRPALTRRVNPPEPTLHFSLAPLRLLREMGLAAAPVPMETPEPDPASAAYLRWCEQEGLGAPHLVIHLGGRDTKAWPTEAWEEFVPRAVALSRGPVVLVAGPDEQGRLDRIMLKHGAGVVRAPLLRLTDLMHLLRSASAFVGCDSGVMHLSVALRTPTIALFFRSNPYHYAPLGADHATVLLADPYGIVEEEWSRSTDGPPRSALYRALPGDAPSRLGLPETGPRALAAVEAALHGVLRRTESAADSTGSSLPRGGTSA